MGVAWELVGLAMGQEAVKWNTTGEWRALERDQISPGQTDRVSGDAKSRTVAYSLTGDAVIATVLDTAIIETGKGEPR